MVSIIMITYEAHIEDWDVRFTLFLGNDLETFAVFKFFLQNLNNYCQGKHLNGINI